MPPAPSRDRGLHILEVPLQGASALGAAPAAVVLAGGEHPPQPQLAEGFAAHAQGSAGLGGRPPDPPAVRRGDGGVHQLPDSWARVKRKQVHPEERASTSRSHRPACSASSSSRSRCSPDSPSLFAPRFNRKNQAPGMDVDRCYWE